MLIELTPRYLKIDADLVVGTSSYKCNPTDVVGFPTANAAFPRMDADPARICPPPFAKRGDSGGSLPMIPKS
jgi:hypothetical protein